MDAVSSPTTATFMAGLSGLMDRIPSTGWFLALLCVGSIGCTTIDYKVAPPSDFPHLTVIEYYGDVPCFLSIACTFFNFNKKQCHIYYQPNPAQWVKNHEEAHCRGYDHNQETFVRDLWEQWKHDNK